MPKEQNFVANLIAQRGNRCTASILGYLEDHVYKQFPSIPTEVQKRIRQEVLDQVNSFKDLAIDIIKADPDHINEFWVQKIDEMHQDLLRAIQRERRAAVG